MKGPLQLTPAEYEIVEILWASNLPLSVTEVLDVIRERKSVAYTTVMTILDKLARKGSVRRVKKGKAYFYSPHVDRSQVLSRLLAEFADQYFDGQQQKLVDFVRRKGLEVRRGNQANSAGVEPAEALVKGRPPRQRIRREDEAKKELDVCLL